MTTGDLSLLEPVSHNRLIQGVGATREEALAQFYSQYVGTIMYFPTATTWVHKPSVVPCLGSPFQVMITATLGDGGEVPCAAMTIDEMSAMVFGQV